MKNLLGNFSKTLEEQNISLIQLLYCEKAINLKIEELNSVESVWKKLKVKLDAIADKRKLNTKDYRRWGISFPDSEK